MNEAAAAQISFSHELSAFLGDKALSNGFNLVYSPLCIYSLLNFLVNGTTGPTHQQLRKFLKIPAPYTASPIVPIDFLRNGYALGGPRIYDESGVWVDPRWSSIVNLKSTIRTLALSVYSMAVYALPLRSMPEVWRKTINSWVEQETCGLINTLFLPQSITGDTRLVLSNAVLFKGKWDAHFRPLTTSNNFCLLDGNLIQTLFIVSEQTQFISAYDGFKVLKLPYQQGSDWRKFSFYIFLPNAFNGLPDLWAKLSAQSDFLNNHIPERRVPVGNFRVPKFKISMTFTFAQYLTELGLDLPFKMTGDFSPMVDSLDATNPMVHSLDVTNHYVSEIAHACFVEVDEKGTEPTAASLAADPAGCSMPTEPIDFEADHPFLFFIREETMGVVFFAGHLLNPLVE